LTYKRINTDCTYPIGMDPGLGISGGALDIGNRIKMKTAIFYALFQMTIGLILSGFNHLHKKDCLSFFTESVMAILILWGLIGYICPYYIIKFFTNPVLDSDVDDLIPIKTGDTTQQHLADSKLNIAGILSYLSSSFMSTSYKDDGLRSVFGEENTHSMFILAKIF